MEIVHAGIIIPKVYAEKRMRSFQFLNSYGQKEAIGVIMPYCYDLGLATSKRTILITSGALTDSVSKYVYTPDGAPLIFKAGEHIIFECSKPVTYRCLYG